MLHNANKSDSRRRLNATGASASPGGDYIRVGEGPTETDGFVHEQWVLPDVEEKTPWKTIAIIFVLFVGGSICIFCAAMDLKAGSFKDSTDRFWALVIIGGLTIIPGGYYFYILVCIGLRRPGYSMDDIRRLG
ncbi:CG2611 [Drosophila busckii]|uniref:CG2611 n=1 Tax=Drosophila busckii TaxID=30019 RepID=A0A0M4ET07_DROBS|nr:transmembrane protein 230 [Drosophila busckii]ALC40307.1 CG2611 [Drosophila busckii]